MVEDSAKTEDLWTPFKELQSVVETVVSRPVRGVLRNLENILRKHKQNFITLLKNPPKNAKHREELKKGITEGIHLPGVGHQVLSKELVDETLIISDMYELNEYMALDLLCTAQQQMPNYPGLTRGLVAVLLYYDGRKALVTTLRTLVQARRGISWMLDCTEDVTNYITKYTDQLMKDDLIIKILDLLDSLDLSHELELLQQNRALGGPKHHHQVVELFQSIRQTLADIVYFWAAQCGLPKKPTYKLIQKLKACKIQEDASGGIDSVTLALEMALLYALDLSVLQHREDGEDVVTKLPLIADKQFSAELLKDLLPTGKEWENPGLQALAHMAWGLALATLRMAPQNLHPPGFMDEDDLLVESAIDLRVFEFLHRTFLENESIYKEEFYMRRLHILLTDFVVLMPLKVKELRNRADETARIMQVYAQEGLEPPANLPHHFEHLLLAVARLYRKDPLKLNLVLDYWCPPDGPNTPSSFPYRAPPRQVSLFKFVRLAGDLLPPSLFVPYMKMICSLASSTEAARHAFNLLKQNLPGATVSWDHFFRSLNRYYSNLRQELPPASDTVYHQRSYPRGITPQEIQGLQAVLAVIRTVAEQDESSRVALCDNPNWAPLSVLLGLVSCSVPIPLKADLLLTLAALARSPNTAATLWHNLEASQILATVPSTSSYQPRGVQTELEEIESRNEEFPLTRALLHLLDVLTDVPVPRLLGVGTRTPGFDPYLNFVINSVFLRFNTRSYKNPEEKWNVARGCLELMVKLVAQYEPRPEDFSGARVELQGGGVAQVNPPPGYHLMVMLNSKSELLRLVLYLLDEGCHLLDSYSPFPGKEALEASVLCCLRLLDKGLSLQHHFIDMLSSAGSNLLLTGLVKLLLGMNPRSGKPDHLLNVAKYLTYNSWLPKHALFAVRILLAVTSYPVAHTQMVGMFTSTATLTTHIRHGFVECLENDQSEALEEDDGKDEDPLGVQGRTKEGILKLLQQSLNHSAPNTAHYLLGFDLHKDIRKTVFQQPGFQGFPRTCLHSLLTILDASLEGRTTPFIASSAPRIVELAYALLFSLCANSKTSEPILRFLRSCNEFLPRHLSALPFGDGSTTSELNQMSWLLKTIAIELKVTESNMQQSHLAHLVSLLVREEEDQQSVVEEEAEVPDMVTSGHLSQVIVYAKSYSIKTQMQLILRLLKFLEFSVERVSVPTWEFFEPSQIEQVLLSCEVTGSGGLKVIDVKRLHRILMEELAAIQSSSTTGQRQLITQEIQSVLATALQQNRLRALSASKVRYVDGWRQVAEVLFSVAPPDLLSLEMRKQLLLDCVHMLLRKVRVEGVSPELANLASGAVLLLLVNLRHSLIQPPDSDEVIPPVTTSKRATLKVVLSSILEWVLSSGVGSQTLRTNLYAALLNFLHILCKAGRENATLQANLDVLVGLGQGLVDVLCHDCSGGHDVCKMLALSLLDVLVELDPHDSWMSFMSSRGYLKHIIESLLEADNKLVSMLEVVPNSLRPLYLYESKMSLLCRIASTHSGAEMLLEQSALTCLASMTVFDRHPDIRPSSLGMDIDFIPSVGSRYMQILFPALNLCDAVLTSLGTSNQSCTVQVINFLLSHSETVNTILRSASPYVQLIYLKELARLTGVIARSATQDYQDAIVPVQRLQQLMLSLIPRFLVSEPLIRELAGTSVTEEPELHLAADSGEAVLYFLQVACHLVLYARNIVASKGLDHRATSVIFQPELTDFTAGDRKTREYSTVIGSGPPNLGVVVQQLVQCVNHYHREKSNLDFLTRKLTSVPNMNTAQLKEFLPASTNAQSSIPEMRTAATRHLEARVRNKCRELHYCSFLIENCLYLVWSHLDYYMLRAIPRHKFKTTEPAAPHKEMAWNVTAEALTLIKQGLVSIFNDSFSKKLVDVKQDQMNNGMPGFVEALLRRIKRLIQFVPT